MSERLQYGRVGLSLPCMLPVVPGTPRTDAPIEERTETCNVDAWWTLGAAFVCDLHFREALAILEEDYDALVARCRADMAEDFGQAPEIPNATERKPWAEMHRYPQRPDVLPDGHPVKT